MNSPKGVKSGVPERVSISFPAPHVAPVTIYPKQLVTIHMSQLMNKCYITVSEQRCQICEQCMYHDHIISEK